MKNADLKDIMEIAQEIERLSKRAQSREVDLANIRGGTFRITNIGFIVGTHATPMINYPETVILATGRIIERPVVRDGKVVIRSIMPLSLSFDHRVIDGALAARFMNAVVKHVQDPALLR